MGDGVALATDGQGHRCEFKKHEDQSRVVFKVPLRPPL
jgi:hypothetical protein